MYDTHFFILNGSILDKISLRYSALMFQDFDRVNQVNPLSQTEYVQESQTNILWGGRFLKNSWLSKSYLINLLPSRHIQVSAKSERFGMNREKHTHVAIMPHTSYTVVVKVSYEEVVSRPNKVWWYIVSGVIKKQTILEKTKCKIHYSFEFF